MPPHSQTLDPRPRSNRRSSQARAFERRARAIGCMQKKVSPHAALVRLSPPVEELSVTSEVDGRNLADLRLAPHEPRRCPLDPDVPTSRRPTRRRRAHASATRAPSPGPESIRTVRGATARPGSLTLDEPNPCSRLGPTHGGLGQTASTRRGRAGRVCEREESRGSAVVRRPSSVAGELPETGLRLGIGCAWHHRVRAVRHADHCSGVVALSGPMAAPTRSGSF